MIWFVNFGRDISNRMFYFSHVMKAKQMTSGYKVFVLSICLSIFGTSQVKAQSDNSVKQITNSAVEQINRVGDEAKAKYAENIDRPYVPVKVNPDYNLEEVKASLTMVLKKYVNYFSVSKVPAYRNLSTGIVIKKITNGEVTNDYLRFTSTDKKDTISIYFKDIINHQISYFVKITEGGFYMPYVRVKDHLMTCGGKEAADLIFYMQHQYAVKYYQEDLENFNSLAQKYLESSEKPVMEEDQRKLFVQGNAMNTKLDYAEALIYYDKAISLNPVSYPEGYYNYALIASLAEKYELAILNMKKYLLLMPNAQDSIAARDKIYEWEALIVN